MNRHRLHALRHEYIKAINTSYDTQIPLASLISSSRTTIRRRPARARSTSAREAVKVINMFVPTVPARRGAGPRFTDAILLYEKRKAASRRLFCFRQGTYVPAGLRAATGARCRSSPSALSRRTSSGTV